MRRIRHWNNLTLYGPSELFAHEHIAHIHELFGDPAAWSLIKTHLPDMLRVVLSISQRKIRSSAILRKLGTESRKNRLYLGFRVLGRVLRTLFLLHFMHDEELHRIVSAATNIAEAWSGFVQ